MSWMQEGIKLSCLCIIANCCENFDSIMLNDHVEAKCEDLDIHLIEHGLGFP